MPRLYLPNGKFMSFNKNDSYDAVMERLKKKFDTRKYDLYINDVQIINHGFKKYKLTN